MSTMREYNNRQKGAVSIFIVIFVALLITVITVSFVRIMTRDQQQASTADLSQSAYDSAMAGVEDAKRAYARYLSQCTGGGTPPAFCSTVATSDPSCDMVNTILTGSPSAGYEETPIRTSTSTGDSALDQAYTCARIQIETEDYEYPSVRDELSIVPLRASDSFDRVRISWFHETDLSAGSTTFAPRNDPVTSSGYPLPRQTAWGANTPPVLEVQLIQFAEGNLRAGLFDAPVGATTNTGTLFLYPHRSADSTNLSFGDDIRRTPSPLGDVWPIQCATASAGGYSCSTTIRLPNPIGSGDRSAYLRVVPRYANALYKVELLAVADLVLFDGVQPIVDVTGRASNLFRRVESRIELSAFPYPDAAVGVAGNLCKDFSVTDTEYGAGSCNPSEPF